MRCEQVKAELQKNDGKSEQDYSDALFDHLTGCSQCWTFAESLWKAERVHDAVYEPGPEEVDSILDRAWNAGQGRKQTAFVPGFRKLAAAAVIVVVASVVFLQTGRFDTPQQGTAPIVMNASVTRQVDFLLTSAQALDNATITLELDDNLALDGYPGMKRISWLTTIRAGDNRLTLPLTLQDDNDGVITFDIESGGRHKQMMFTVQPSDQGANTQVI